MEIKLTQVESEKLFYDALCNAVGTGYMESYGIELECDRSQYKSSKDHLLTTGKSCCYEDVLMQVLHDGGKLTFTDHEGEGDMTRSITLTDVHERVQKAPARSLINMLQEGGDASDSDQVIQTVFFEEVVFG
jgi:hypothetical protein